MDGWMADTPANVLLLVTRRPSALTFCESASKPSMLVMDPLFVVGLEPGTNKFDHS